MKIAFLTVGRPADWPQQAVNHYTKFLMKYAQVEAHSVRAVSSQATTAEVERRTEGERLLSAASSMTGYKIACDSSGRPMSSERFAQLWRTELDLHGGRAIIIIGGPWGLDKSVLEWADLVWSLGSITLPHELALIVAMEQIARAFSINRGESYHR